VDDGLVYFDVNGFVGLVGFANDFTFLVGLSVHICFTI